MNFEEFKKSLAADEPPSQLPRLLAAVWWDAKGDWKKAHDCAQESEAPDHAWVHAYLHRKGGDMDNARYWYERAGRDFFNGELEDEWTEITNTLLAK
jgi:hypothetical protein